MQSYCSSGDQPKFFISSLPRNFNEIVCVDQFHLDRVHFLHCIDAAMRYSAAHVVGCTALDEAVFVFEACWLQQFWLPKSVQGDKAFATGGFKNYMDEPSISFRLVPFKTHSNNPAESKHGVMGSFFRSSELLTLLRHLKLHACRAVAISNDLYVNDVLCLLELAKGYSKPTSAANVKVISDDVVEAHEKLQAKTQTWFNSQIEI